MSQYLPVTIVSPAQFDRGTAQTPGSQREAASELHSLMAELEQPQRAVFLMVELEGKTAPEIAGELGLKLATVYSRLRLARQKLQALIRLRSAPCLEA